MEIMIFGIFFAIFLVLLWINIHGKSKLFGLFAGFMLLMIAVFMIQSDISIPIGETYFTNYTSNVTTMNTTYLNTIEMFGSPMPLNFLVLMFLMIAIYMIFANSFSLFTKFQEGRA